MLKRIFLPLFLYHLIFVFVVSTSVYAAVRQPGHKYTTRITEGDPILFKTSSAEKTGENNRKIGAEPVAVEEDHELNWVAADVGMGLAVLVGVGAGIGIPGETGGRGAVGSFSPDTISFIPPVRIGTMDWVTAAGVGIGLAVLVGAVAAGIGSEDDDGGSGEGGSRGTDTINFKSPIRIGDDNDYNGTHDDSFQINTPFGLTYSESVTVSGGFSKGTLKYTIAGAKESAKIYMNGALVGRSCNPGNTAYAKNECDPVDVTSQLRSGNNVLKIACGLDPYDNVTPYDDIEIYNMRLILDQ